MPGYAEEVYDYIDSEDSTFKDKVSKEDFKTATKEKSYSDEIYGYMAELDSSFKDKIDEQVFFEAISDGSKKPKDKEVVSQFDVKDEDLFDEQTVNDKFNPYIEALSNPNYRSDKVTDDKSRLAELAKIESDKQEFLQLINDPDSKDKIKAAQLLENLSAKMAPSEEEVDAKVKQQKDALQNTNLTQQSGGKFAGTSLMYALADKENNKDLINKSLPNQKNKDSWSKMAYDAQAKKWLKDPNDLSSGYKAQPEGTSLKGRDMGLWSKNAKKKSNEKSNAFYRQYEDMVNDVTASVGLGGVTSDKSKADENTIYLPSIEQVKENPEIINDIVLSQELVDRIGRDNSYAQIAADNLDKKENRDEIDRVLSEFEDKEGVGLWNDIVNITASQITVGNKHALEKAFGKTTDELFGIEEKSRDKYEENKKDLKRLLELSKEGDDYKALGILNNIQNQTAGFLAEEKVLNDLKRKIESDPNATQADVDEFNNIKNRLLLSQKNIQADIKYLGDMQFEGANSQEIIDKTQKTYNFLETQENILANSGVRIMTGLGSLSTELNTVNLLEHVGVKLKNEDGSINQEWVEWGNDVLGETGGAILTAKIVKEVAEDNATDKLLQKAYNYGEELLNRNRPPQRYDEIEGVDQAMRWGVDMLTGQILNTGMSIVIPGGGGLLLSSLSESGNQMHEMKKRIEGEKWNEKEVKYIDDFKKEFGFNPLGDDDTYKIKPEDINALQFYGTAGIYGIAEYASEKITLGNFKLGAKNLRKAFDLSKGIKKGMPITNKINQRWINLREAGKDFAKGIPGESLGEGAVTLSQNAAEIYILGNKDVSMLDGVNESMMSGLVMSGTMQSPGLLAQTYTAFRGPDANAKIAKRGMEMLNLSNQIGKFEAQLKGLTPQSDSYSDIASAKRLAENRLHNLAQQQLDSQSETRKNIVSYTKTDRQALIDTYNAEHKVRAEIDRINDNTALDPKVAAELINEQQVKLVGLEAFKNSVVGNAEWNADKTRARKFSNAYRAKNNLLGEVEMVVGNNNKEALQAGLDYVDTRKDLTAEEKNQVKEQMKMTFEDAKKASRGDSTVNGFAFGDNLTVETTSPDGTKTTKKLDLPMTFALNRSNTTVQSHEIGHHTLFKQFMENNPDAVGLVKDLESYVKKNYGKAYEVFLETKELYGKYDSKGNLTNSTLVAEENLARLSDFMRQNNLEADRTLHNKMFGRFQKFNDGSGQIKTGKDVFDMLTSFNQSFETGELSGLTKTIAESAPVVSETSQAKKSMTKAEQNKVEDTLNDAPGQRNKDGKYTMTKAEWRADKNRAFSKAYNALMNGDLDGLIIAKMASGKDIFGQAREEFISDARDKIGQHMLNFDPQMQDSLFGWVNSYISRKVGDVAKKAKREKAKTPGTKISTDQKLGEEGRTVAETIEGDTASDIEAAVDRSLNAKKKGVDNLRTRLGIEKGGKIYNKVVDSVKKVFGAKLPEVSNKNFKEALKKDFNTLLFKDIKNDIGTRAKYKEFIKGDITFKDADGNTKTMPRWEMLYDYISQSTFNKRFEPFIEPLINPETGNQARPDNNPLFTKKKITKEQWVEYFLGDKVGASTKGTRKDALASAIAQELAFDATMETISDPDIQARIKDIYETQGLRQAENYLEQVAKEIDRKPDSKFSITKKPVVERLQKHMEDSKGITPIEAFDNFYNKLNESDKQAIISERSAIENISKKEAKRFNRKIKEPKAKRKEEKKVLARQDQIVEEAGYKPLERRGDGRVDSIKYLMSSFFPKLFKTFGDVSGKLIKPSNWSPSGNEAFSYYPDGSLKGGAIKRAQFFITSAIKTIKTIPGTLKAIEKGNLETLDTVKKLQKNTDLKNLPTEKKSNIEIALKNQKTKDLDTNLKNRAQHKKGSMAYLSLLKEMYDADNNMLPGIQVLNYNQNANDASYRNLAQLIGVENGIEKGREEHIYQAGPWSTRVLQAITAKNPKVFEAFNKWQADNYYQETIAGKNKEGTSSENLIDGTYTMPDGSTWDSQSQEHPILKKALDEAMVTGDFSNVPSPDIRKYNEVFHLNPNNMIREGISDATRYNVEVAEDLRNIPEVIELQAELIFLQLSGQIDAATAKGYLEAGLPIAKAKFSVTKDNKKMLNDSGVVDTSTELTNAETIEQAGVLDDALNVARNPKAPIKKIRVFDFDDTLATTKSDVLYTAPDGTNGKLNAEEFATQGKELLDQGYKFDFSEFNKVTKGKPGPLLDIAKKIQAARGTEDVFVLTARAPEAQAAIKEFLDSLGLNIPLKNITGLGNSTGEAKAQWLVGKAAEGYNDFYFADDAMQNVDAVKKAMSVLDVKSKVQQAKAKFSKTVDKTVNDIIEHKTGIKSESEYSDVKARLKGRKKGRFEMFIPPSAEDFVGLLYKMLGKGEIGNMQMDFFKEHLLDPYGRAMENLSRDQNRMINDFKALKDQLVKEGLIPKDLNKKAFGEYTLQDVARVLAWNKQGFDIPGISKSDLKQILDYAKKNPAIDVFAQNLIDINKGDGYSAPNADWLGGTISTDLLDGLRTGKRSKYLQQWQENVDLIFSPKNLNKMEAAFGTKYREAMEDMLGRMKSGRNRSNKMGRLENRLLDYINNSVGTVMFFNMRSALLQTISAVNFIDFGSNNVFRAAKAFANQPQYWKDFMELMNSEFLVERRNGLKLNVSESEIADAAATSKNKAKAAVAYILQKGYLPTQFADSFAIASGGATFYRNRIDALMKEGMSEADAKKQAFLEFREIAEESQQSSRPDRVSQQQASVLGRLILAFQNTPMQMNRLGKKAFLDLKNRRKRPGMTQFQSDMSNASRVTYYFAVQSAIFSALQQALFALAFDDEEEEAEKERYYNVANGMLNTFLNGTGMVGVAASTLISVGRKVYKESAKEGQFPGPNYEDAANEMLNFSPPIDIKLSKLRQAGLTWKYEGYKHDEANWGIDDPAYKSAAYVISGLTNVPLDRLISKSENVRSAIEDEQQNWKRVSLILGWRDYQLNSTEQRKEYVTSQKEAKSAYRKKMKDKGKRQYKPKNLMTIKQFEEEKIEKQRIKYKKLNQAEQVRKLDSLGLSKKQIKSLKYEKDRVAKLIQLMNK